MAMAIPVMESALEGAATYGPKIVQGAAALHLGSKMAEKYKGKVGNMHLKGTTKSASKWFNSRFKQGFKGYKKLPGDVLKAAGKTSKYISSGKAVKALDEVSRDISTLGSTLESVGGKSSLTEGISKLQQPIDKAKHVHEILDQYNEKGKELASQFDRYQ